jgi:competence ComEA-like helix-hairpin-helix protein
MHITHRSVAILFFTFVLLALCVAAQSKKTPPAKPIDLNLANAKELQELPGVGPVTAQRIIDLRTKNGRFKRVEDLLAVRGISQKKLDAMRPYVMVSPPQTTTPKSSPAPPNQNPQGASPSNGRG